MSSSEWRALKALHNGCEHCLAVLAAAQEHGDVLDCQRRSRHGSAQTVAAAAALQRSSAGSAAGSSAGCGMHAMPHSAAAVQAESQGGVQSVRENHRILPIETMMF